MLTTLEVFLYGAVVLILLPLTVSSLIGGSRPPAASTLARYYQAQPGLMLAGNVFLLTISASAIHRLAQHFGYLDATAAERIGPWIMAPFLVMLLVFLALFVKAILKVRRGRSTPA